MIEAPKGLVTYTSTVRVIIHSTEYVLGRWDTPYARGQYGSRYAEFDGDAGGVFYFNDYVLRIPYAAR